MLTTTLTTTPQTSPRLLRAYARLLKACTRLQITRKMIIYSLLFFGYSIAAQAQYDYREDFMNAIEENDIETVRIFIEQDVELDIQDEN